MSPIRILTPAQYIKAMEDPVPRKPRKAKWWIKITPGLEIGPFIEEADARLACSALALYREDLTFSVSDKMEGL